MNLKELLAKKKAELLALEPMLKSAEVTDETLAKSEALIKEIQKLITYCKPIRFDGNGYSDEWKEEAARRGLSNYPSTAECLAAYASRKNIDLVTRHGIFTEEELGSRAEILFENYVKTMHIEALPMGEMMRRQYAAKKPSRPSMMPPTKAAPSTAPKPHFGPTKQKMETKVKLTPMTMGRRAPTFHTEKS